MSFQTLLSKKEPTKPLVQVRFALIEIQITGEGTEEGVAMSLCVG
jgi:hypothetical protein